MLTNATVLKVKNFKYLANPPNTQSKIRPNIEVTTGDSDIGSLPWTCEIRRKTTGFGSR